jgi:hypothetical protein
VAVCRPTVPGTPVSGSCGLVHGLRFDYGRRRRFCFVAGADQLPSHFPDRDDASERALFYVALTRPEELLIVFYGHDTPFLRELEHNLKSAMSLQGEETMLPLRGQRQLDNCV